MILEGPADELQLTKNTQPAILVVSYSIYKVLEEEFDFNFGHVKYYAGHSLGEYSALVSSNALEFDDAVLNADALRSIEVTVKDALDYSDSASLSTLVGVSVGSSQDVLTASGRNSPR